jgi:hypothetical protein
MYLKLPDGKWKATWLGEDGKEWKEAALARRDDGAWEVKWDGVGGIQFDKQ